ncbi:integrin beta-5-like [Mercenaria mercenaria]|uniref:integrin beta-5-like n=1 Tax=Mercenaria mercenaria TaxID=6596 RepID=UPI00234E4AD0|nr:integrin beta-5-like [Mercenaria mercenaria]
MRCLVLLTFVTLAGLVYSESCTDTRSCFTHGTTECHHHSHAFCNPTINQCVCATAPVGSGAACTAKDDCADCQSGDRDHKHCIDGHCACTQH